MEIWFDDGYTSVYDVAYPIMKRRRLTGIVAVVTGAVGKNLKNWKKNIYRPCMTIEQLKELINDGWIISSHTVSHPLNFDELTHEQTCFELVNSKQWITENLGVMPTQFVVPRHRIRKDQLDLAREVYSYIRPLAPGQIRYPPDIVVYHWVEVASFEKRLTRDLTK